MDSKTCSACGVEKPLAEFHKKLDKYQSACKECRNKTAKARKAKPKVARPKTEKRRTAVKANGHVSLLDAAAKILASAGEPMKVKPLAEAVIQKGEWKGGGKTPSQTLSGQIQREIATKGKESRFARAGRGLFVAKE